MYVSHLTWIMSLHYLEKPEMLIGHVLPLSCYRKKLHNLSHLNYLWERLRACEMPIDLYECQDCPWTVYRKEEKDVSRKKKAKEVRKAFWLDRYG